MKKGIFIIVWLPLLWVACSKEPVKVDTSTGQQLNRKLTVEVKHRYQLSPVKDSLVSGAQVKMFFDAIDRDEDTHLDRERTTGVDGKVVVEYLKDTTYFVRVQHDSLGSIDRTVNITDQTSSAFEYFLFY